MHRAESDGLAAAAACAAASFFAVNDTHLPKVLLFRTPFPAVVVNVATNPVLPGNSTFSFSVCVPAFHALHQFAAFFDVADGSAA